MELLKTIQSRCSTRAFTDEAVLEEHINILLESAQAAPVGMNDYQSLHLTVLQNKELLDELRDATAEAYRKLM